MSEVIKSAGCRNGVHDACSGGFNSLDGPRACKCECHGHFRVVAEETQVGHTHHWHHEGCDHTPAADEPECVCGNSTPGLYCCGYDAGEECGARA